MRVIPEDHLRNFLRKPFRDKPAQKALRSLSVDDTCPRSRPISLSEPSRSLRRKPFEISVETPFRTILREVPPVPEASPEAISLKASFDTPSKQTLRFFLRNMPRVPKVKPKDPFRCKSIPLSGMDYTSKTISSSCNSIFTINPFQFGAGITSEWFGSSMPSKANINGEPVRVSTIDRTSLGS